MSLRWDQERNGFDVTLRFDAPYEDRLQPKDPLSIDIERLRSFSNDEPAYGAALTKMFFSADMAAFYARALAATEHGAGKLRLRLHIDAPDPFHAIRWESLRDPASGEPIATRSGVLLSRYLSNPNWPDLVLRSRGLHALIVVAGPWDIGGYRAGGRLLEPVEVEEELKRARRALAGFQVVGELAFGTATLANMMEALHQGVDVVHLVCRGSLSGDSPQLYLEKANGTADVIDADRLTERLSELERPPTVVMLCSCQSPRPGGEAWTLDEGRLSALGPPLAAAGVASVIAMQANVSARTVVTFASAFFAAFARHGIVDEAMAAARGVIREEKDWWVPVLFSRLRGGRTYYPPGFAGRAENTWAALESAIAQGYATPVLGPGLTDPIHGSLQDIARGWVKRWHLPIPLRDQNNLAKIAQYLTISIDRRAPRLGLRRELAQEISDRRNQAKPDDPIWNLPSDLLGQGNVEAAIAEIGRRQRSIDEDDPHRVIAGLPVPVYVTTGWTDLLQEALLACGKEPTTDCFAWNRRRAWKDTTSNDISPTTEKPLVCHLFGRLNDPDSLVLTEDDHFRWLEAWIENMRMIQPAVARALIDSSLLFLGFQPDDSHLRFVLRGINTIPGSAGLQRSIHVAVIPGPQNYEMEQEVMDQEFGVDRIRIYRGETREFLHELRQRARPAT